MSALFNYLARTGRRVLVYLIEDVSLFSYLVAFVLVVVVLGWAYSYLTPFCNGVGRNGECILDLTFFNGLYFSIVTVSSLGYGDLHPVGFSKVLACAEVLFGLAYMGIVIAKVTSRRLSYHVGRLFGSDAQKQLDWFSANFGKLATELSVAMGSLGRAYQRTPGGVSVEDKDKALSNFRATLVSIHSACLGLKEYLSSEVEQGNYFAIVPSGPVCRVGDAVDAAFFNLAQLIISLSPDAKLEILDRQNRQRISDTLSSQKLVCQLVQRHAKDLETNNRFLRVLETCEGVLERYFTAPVEIRVTEQPDQVLSSTDAPQEPTT